MYGLPVLPKILSPYQICRLHTQRHAPLKFRFVDGERGRFEVHRLGDFVSVPSQYYKKKIRGKRTHLTPDIKEVCMKAKLNELFKGITQSKQRVSRITEQGNNWLVSFENQRLGSMYITARNSNDIAQEINRHAQFVGVSK